MMSMTPTAFQALVEADPERAIGGMRMVVRGGAGELYVGASG